MCDFRVQSRRHRARAVVCLSWLLEYFHCRKIGGEPDECVNPTRKTRQSTLVLVAGVLSLSQNRWGARRMRQSHKEDAPEHVTAGAGSASLSATSPWCRRPPRRASRVRASSWARAPSSPRYTAALVDAPLRSVCRASACCGKPYRTAPPTRPTPSPRPRSLTSSTPPEVCPETTEFDIRRRHGTTTTHAPHSSPNVGQGRDEHALPGLAFLAPAPSRAAAHLVITRKEIKCTRCHSKIKETIKFVNPTSNKIMGSRNLKTWCVVVCVVCRVSCVSCVVCRVCVVVCRVVSTACHL